MTAETGERLLPIWHPRVIGRTIMWALKGDKVLGETQPPRLLDSDTFDRSQEPDYEFLVQMDKSVIQSLEMLPKLWH